MKKINDIFDEFRRIDSKGAKEKFCQCLKNYIHNKYRGIDEYAALAKFTDAYVEYLLDLEKNQNCKVNPDKRKIKNLASKNIPNWLNPKCSIKRETIIDIAFILADPKQKNGESIANDLLQQMHYPKLHASSELEIFYIYAFRNGLRYSDCLKLYKIYLERDQVEISDDEGKYDHDTSTVFHDGLLNIDDKEKLFSFVDSKRQYFGVASRKMNAEVLKRFHRMMAHKIVIKNGGNKPTLIADEIKKIIKKEKIDINSFDSKSIEFSLSVAPKYSFAVYISNKETADYLYNIILDNGGKADIYI